MASGTQKLTATPPMDTHRGPDGFLLAVMTGLAEEPATGRLLRGLTPFLEKQGADNVILLTERMRKEPWSGDAEPVAYQEIVHWERNEQGGVYRGACARGKGLAPDQTHIQQFGAGSTFESAHS